MKRNVLGPAKAKPQAAKATRENICLQIGRITGWIREKRRLIATWAKK